jgi:site-specific recombinase XerD
MSGKTRKRYQTYTRKDGSIAYIVDTRNAEGRKVRKVFDRLSDADEYHAKLRLERIRLNAGLPVPITEKRCKDFLDQWMEQRKAEKQPMSSWVSDEQRIRFYIKPAFGMMLMSRVQTHQVQRFLDSLIQKYKISPRTRNIIRGVMHRAFSMAIKQRNASFNPVSGTTILDVSEEKWDYWKSTKEVEAYLNQSSQDVAEWFYPLVSLLVQTGLRVGEALALRWDEDLNLDEGWIYVAHVFERETGQVQDRTKGKAARVVGLNESLKVVLSAYRASRPVNLRKSGAYVFTWPDGRIVTHRRVRKVHDRVCQRADVKRIRVHDLRHQFATLFIKGKGNQKVLQKLLGHTTGAMTDKYTHLDTEFLREQASVVTISPIQNAGTYPAQNTSSKKLTKRTSVRSLNS